jgi:uncharacterized protein YbjT (DUF2867 family)
MTLVVGATGSLGFETCARLRAKGVSVRALVRPDSPRKSEFSNLDIEVASGDLKDPASLEAACAGARCVVSTASAMNSRNNADNLKTVDLKGHASLVRAAKNAGVEHFVHVSISSEANPRAVLVRYKRRVERIVRESGMAWTVIQPAAFMETWFSPAGGWEIDRGRVRIVGPGTTRFNPVSLYDVAEFAALSVVRDDLRRRVIPVGGPDVITAVDALQMLEEMTGRSFAVKQVSAAVIGVASRMLRPFDPALSSAFALAVGSGHDEVIDMALVLAEIPVELTTLRQFFERFLLEHNIM